MTCLNDSHIQALADGEPLPEAAAHAAGCAACAARVRERQALMAALTSAIDVPANMPPPVEQRVSFRLKAEATSLVREQAGRPSRSCGFRSKSCGFRSQSRGFRLEAEGLLHAPRE